MATKATAIIAENDSGVMTQTVITRRAMGPKDVLMKIIYCGICHSDLHQVRNEWKGAKFPCCPGHELAGVAEAVGSAVTKHKVGDKIGVGVIDHSCQKCDSCKRGFEQYCPDCVQTYNSDLPEGGHTFGGFSTHTVIHEDFVFRIPENLDLAQAAPLLCAGATMFTPLKQLNAGPGMVVGIVGVGGLGHVGVKLARAMGCEVVGITRTATKKDEVIGFGAHRLLVSSDKTAMASAKKSIDIILDTVSDNHDLGPYLDLLKTGGTHVLLGISPTPLSLRVMSLVPNNVRLMGSMIAGCPHTQEMLDFCGKHNITAMIEKISADYVNTAFDRLAKGDVRYRFVIEIADTLPKPSQ